MEGFTELIANRKQMAKTGWIETFTGRMVFPLDPSPEQFCIEDIAHALSRICRFGGHCKDFYSVAQHSVLVSLKCPSELARWGLLHDAAEAYIGDMPRPIKQQMAFYGQAEDNIMKCIMQRFGLEPPTGDLHMPAEVKMADDYMLVTEAKALLRNAGWIEHYGIKAGKLGQAWSPDEAKEKFLERYRELT